MRKVSMFIAMSLFLIVHLAYGSEQKQAGRYVNQHKLSAGLTAVVAEGDFEPRSIGSYSVRIYGANPEFPIDDFLCGTIRSRDGSIEKIMIQDLNGDGNEEIIIIIRSVGTGGYLSADAFQYQSKQLKLIANVTDLRKNADPIHELTKILKTNTKQMNSPDKK
jgi:hypothetical protein